jgi:hypothetical protein
MTHTHIDHTRWRRIEAGKGYQQPGFPKPIEGRAGFQIVICGDCGKFLCWGKVEGSR